MHQRPIASSALAEGALSLPARKSAPKTRFGRIRAKAMRIWTTGDIPILSDRPIGWRFYALSAQTSAATGSISKHVGAIQAKTAEAVASIEKIVSTTGRIKANADSIAEAVGSQESATREIARNAGLAAGGAAEVAGKISFAAQQATDMGKAAQVMLAEAEATAQRAERLRETVAAFLSEVNVLRG